MFAWCFFLFLEVCGFCFIFAGTIPGLEREWMLVYMEEVQEAMPCVTQ